MSCRLIQFDTGDGHPALACWGDEGVAQRLTGASSTLELAYQALDEGTHLAELAASRLGEEVDIDAVVAEKRLLAPIAHPDPAHLLLSGTGLTHLGSAQGRDEMHRAAAGQHMTDSMRMFNMGLKDGKPPQGQDGVQPEWFYKGDGSMIVASGQALASPPFALDGSEEPEIAGIYLIDPDGVPRRLGFALANEFSDHVTERGNYLWLAHSKLRPAALGGELLLGDLPADIRGTSRVLRNGEEIWSRPFFTGEDNMSHSIGNLERHHFKYTQFRRPGDVHVHFFGTATLSFVDGIETRDGDVFEITAHPFRLALRNRLGIRPPGSCEVRPL
jgi:hypothetical protein